MSQWLDRLSGQSTPVGSSPPFHGRSYSPVPPRRSSHLVPNARPAGLGLGTTRSVTSLDLSANASNESLPVKKLLNGSGLRQEQRPQEVLDPLKVLRSILGIPEGHDTKPGAETNSARGPDIDLVENIDFDGLSLTEYAEKPLSKRKQSREKDGLLATSDGRQKYEDFHDSIAECDGVLASVETYLTNFQAELGQVSAEIENLQLRSSQLNAKLENRRKVEKLLGPAVEEITVSPVTVRTISDGPVEDNFVRALHELETRSASIDSKPPEETAIKAVQDVKPLLDDLKAKAVERVRDFIVAQIKALRSPNVNAQVIQRRTFIKYKDLYVFLSRNHPVLAEEIGQAYANTMKWYYSSNFIRYQTALEKLPLHIIDQHDLLASDPVPARRNALSAAKPSSPQHDPFALGQRANILKTDITTNAIPSYLAENNQSTHHIEIPFLNFNRALISNVCAEYTVANALFSSTTTNTFQGITRKVSNIFSPTFTLGHTLTKTLIDNTTDCLGVLICLRLTQNFAFELQKHAVPVADAYINYTAILLWPRFQNIMDLHCESMKKISAPANRGGGAAFSLVIGADASASKASTAPHPITQRFGQFLHGILTLSTEAGDDEPVSRSLDRLRTEYEALMTKLSRSAGDIPKRNRFLSNNYSLVLTIISDTHGKLAEEVQEHFSTLARDLKGK